MPTLPALQAALSVFSQDPSVRLMQMGLLLLAVLVIFLVFFVLRDILLRTSSFAFQLLCIVLVAFLPGVGFLLYLLIRPPRTIKERQVEKLLREVHARLVHHHPQPQQQHQQKPQHQPQKSAPKKHEKR